MCRALVGLEDVDVVGVIGWTVPIQVHIASTLPRPSCASCGSVARVKQTMRRRLIDLPSFGRPVVTVWRQVRWWCAGGCGAGSWMQTDRRIVIGNRGITDRAARWACEQVGRHGRSVAEVAKDLGCDWHTVNRAVIAYGLALVDDPDRIGTVTTLGLDETAFVRIGRYRERLWSTQLVGDGQLLDVVAGRDATPACEWLATRPQRWRDAIRWVTLDLSGSYRLVADTMLPDAVQVADPFYVVKLDNERLDEVRRRVQNETLGHRGRKSDPLYRTRRLLVMADERLTDQARERRRGLLAAGDPTGAVADAWQAKEAVREIYRIGDPDLALDRVLELADTLNDRAYGPELRSLGRTLRRWAPPIAAWHASHASNGPVNRSRDHQLDPLESPRPALRRPTRLVQAGHHHPSRRVNFRRTTKPGAVPAVCWWLLPIHSHKHLLGNRAERHRLSLRGQVA